MLRKNLLEPYYIRPLAGFKNYVTLSFPSAHSSIIESIEKYLFSECELFILPSLAFSINFYRSKGYLVGNTPYERYESYFSRFNLFTDFPILDVYLRNFVNSTISYFQTAVEHVKKDLPLIQKAFNIQDATLQKIVVFNNSDRHYQGKQTMRLVFMNGRSVIYKPTDLNNEDLLEGIIEEVNLHLNDIKIKNYPFLYIGDHLYRDFIIYDGEVKNTQVGAETFYKQVGMNLALSYVLNATDIHMENLLVSKGNLYIIDRETFFHDNSLIGFEKPSSVFSTGFLLDTRRDVTIDETIEDKSSGILGGEAKRRSLLIPFVIDDCTDTLTIKFIGENNFDPHNRIFIDSKIASPREYTEAIVQGFINVYSVFQKKQKRIKDLIFSYQHVRNRQLIRRTAIYYAFTRQIFQPTNLKDVNFKNKVYTKLKEGFAAFHDKAHQLAQFETDEIFNLNVPFFYTDMLKKDIYAGDETPVSNFLEKTPFDNFLTTLTILSEDDCDKCIQEIRSTLTSHN